jgi:tetratricopeptide (TPR) repeat protein
MLRGFDMVTRILALAVLMITMLSCGGISEEEIWSKVEESKKQAKPIETLRYYELLFEKYPKSARIPEALWNAASLCNNELKDYPASVKYYKDFLTRFPEHRDAPTALFLIGFIYNNELKNIDSARVYYMEFTQRFPTHEMIESVKFELDNLGKDANEVLPPPKSGRTAKKGR